AADGTEGPSEKVIRLSRTAAGAFHSAAIRSLDGLTPDRGVISDAKTFVGSRQGALTGSIFSQVPVVLAEVLTITLPEDEKIAATESGRKRIAEAVTAGTMAALEALQAHSD
ncbi:MAG: hypothetical protein MH204_07580, partial [Fimbriimonadaceae bacterium]|nr:hypothetical protein [Fimbriimonadaceae bacterium]